MTDDAVAAIRRTFDSMYADEGVELPAELEPPGSFTHGRWSVRYALNESDGVPCLDLIVETPHLDQLLRIWPDGDVEAGTMFTSTIVFDPDIDADDAAAHDRHEAHHRHVESLLRTRRLL